MWVYLEGIVLSEISQIEKDRCHVVHLCVEPKITEETKKRTDSEKQRPKGLLPEETMALSPLIPPPHTQI